MQFKVPQFLEIEDKIFGPFTFREFIYLVGGAGLCFTIYKLLGLLLGAVPILIIAGFSLLLVFYKPNNKPFINVLEYGFKYLTQSKLYIWKKNTEKIKSTQPPVPGRENPSETTARGGTRLNKSKLRDLAWSLNVLDLSKQKEN
jgi:hypothetical protein